MSEQAIDWGEIGRKFRQPFSPDSVDFRPQGGGSQSGKAQAVCYVDARVVQDRLDEVVGPGNWSFTYEPLVVDKGQVQIAKGRLTVYGIDKEDVGEASNFDASKGCVSDALKRAAVMWGIGRYLYDIGGEWVTLNQHKQITPEDVKRLRAKLPRPDGTRPTLGTEVEQRQSQQQQQAAPATPANLDAFRRDVQLRKAAALAGYGSVDQFETFMAEATGGDTTHATREQLMAYAESRRKPGVAKTN